MSHLKFQNRAKSLEKLEKGKVEEKNQISFLLKKKQLRKKLNRL